MEDGGPGANGLEFRIIGRRRANCGYRQTGRKTVQFQKNLIPDATDPGRVITGG